VFFVLYFLSFNRKTDNFYIDKYIQLLLSYFSFLYVLYSRTITFANRRGGVLPPVGSRRDDPAPTMANHFVFEYIKMYYILKKNLRIIHLFYLGITARKFKFIKIYLLSVAAVIYGFIGHEFTLDLCL